MLLQTKSGFINELPVSKCTCNYILCETFIVDVEQQSEDIIYAGIYTYVDVYGHG